MATITTKARKGSIVLVQVRNSYAMMHAGSVINHAWTFAVVQSATIHGLAKKVQPIGRHITIDASKAGDVFVIPSESINESAFLAAVAETENLFGVVSDARAFASQFRA